ncbi:hypothetical protein [Cellulosilyticum sp. I15G10I2]|uniref:hypothetical protein n=1 Tax=Cellulosilyticum sp. I15G10I2 TaxID=1892843 RepID=UPI00085BAEB8|nr:hypothetical protein [Cellulosilyticum sp. I15G10I2]
MLIEQSYKASMAKTFCILFIIAITWTGMNLYRYYTGPEVKIDTYIKHLEKKEYHKIYEMFDNGPELNWYSKEQIIEYYTRSYDRENSLVEIMKKGSVIFKGDPSSKENNIAFCNVRYIYNSGEKTVPLYLEKINNEWRIKFPFLLSEVKIHAPLGSAVYINERKIETYENEMYIERNVLPGKYKIQIEFPNQIYSTYNQVINVPDEKEVFLPYNTLNVEVATAKNMIVQLDDIKKNSTNGIASFNNMLEGNYKLRVFSPNNFIDPVEMNIGVDKDTRLFSVFDITLSQTGKAYLDEFIKAFYKSYLQDIKDQKCTHIEAYIHEETSKDFMSNFTQWFIENKNIQDAKIAAVPSQMEIDNLGFLHTDVLETIELTNKEFDEYENRYINRQYQVILEWDTIIDISQEKWLITDRTMKQSIVSYKDLEGKWVQY